MIIFIFVTLFIGLKNLSKFPKNKRLFKNKKNLEFNKRNLKRWMNLTKKERFDLSKKDSASYLTKRKVLLEEIRKEYKRISKNDPKTN